MNGMAQNPQAQVGFTGKQDIDTALGSVEDIERGRAPPRDPPLEYFGQPYQEIKSLVWAKNNPVYSVALEEWERKERLFSGRVERREKSSADLINQIFNLVGFFSGFQGLVLTAVAQLASGSNCKPQCKKVWFPIVLTVLAAFVTIIGILQKFQTLKELEISIETEKQAHREAFRRGEVIRLKGPDFRFYDIKERSIVTAKSFWGNKSRVLLALFAFTAIFILSYIEILCDLWG